MKSNIFEYFYSSDIFIVKSARIVVRILAFTWNLVGLKKKYKEHSFQNLLYATFADCGFSR